MADRAPKPDPGGPSPSGLRLLAARPRTVAALVALTMVSGMVDAVTYVGLDRVFAANMTGNLAVLGFAIAGTPTLSIDGPVVALLAFLLGAAAFGRLFEHPSEQRALVLRQVKIEASVVVIAAAVAIGFGTGDDVRRFVIIALLAAMMGARNETVRMLGFRVLPTTVVTRSIAVFAAHEAEGEAGEDRAGRRDDRLRFVGIVAMLSGATLSALLVLNVALAWPLVAIVLVEGAVLAGMLRSAATGGAATVGP